MMAHRNSDSPVTIPLDNTSGEVAQFGLSISHADTQGTRGKETLPKPPEAGLLTHTGRAGGRFDTTPLSHSSQKPNPSSRIGSQIHRRTTFKEGVATTDRIRGPSCGPRQSPPKRTSSQGTEKEQTQAHRTALDEPDAPLSCSERPRACSMARQRTVIPRSGRRGRRFKSCHPDRYSRRPEARTRNGEGLSCCAGPSKGTLRGRRCACSASTEATWSSCGTKRPQGSDSVTPTIPADR